MGEMLVISPRELYCLGRLLNAEYIDYAYIAAMGDTGGDLRRFSKETAAALVERGLLREDFSGSLEPAPETARLIRPVFFGAGEMTADLCRLCGDKSVTAYKFHFHGDSAVMVRCQDEKLIITPAGRREIMESLGRLIPKVQQDGPGELSPEDAQGIIVLKCVSLKGKAKRAAFVLGPGGTLYREGDKLEAATGEELLRAAEKMLEEM